MITNVTLLINIYRQDEYNGYLCTLPQSLPFISAMDKKKTNCSMYPTKNIFTNSI